MLLPDRSGGGGGGCFDGWGELSDCGGICGDGSLWETLIFEPSDIWRGGDLVRGLALDGAPQIF